MLGCDSQFTHALKPRGTLAHNSLVGVKREIDTKRKWQDFSLYHKCMSMYFIFMIPVTMWIVTLPMWFMFEDIFNAIYGVI